MKPALSNSPIIVLGRYRLQHRIATGSAGSVFAAEDTYEENVPLVVKVFDAPSDSLDPWLKEMRLAMRLRHPNIVRCVNTGYDEGLDAYVMVFERGMGGSLRRAIVSGRSWSEEELLGLLSDLMAALHYAHSQGVMHRDIKPENVVCRNEDGTGPWQLTDFGVGRFLEESSTASTITGTMMYMAPEVFFGRGTTQSDMFSLGLLLLELILGTMPSPHDRARFVLQYRYGRGLRHLVAQLLETNPRNRLRSLRRHESLLAWHGVHSRFLTSCQMRLETHGNDVWLSRDGVGYTYTIPRIIHILEGTAGDAPFAMSERRLWLLRGTKARLLYSSERPVTFLAGSEAHDIVWFLRDGDMVRLRISTGEEASCPVEPELIHLADSGAKPLGVVVDGSRAWVAFAGERVVYRVASTDDDAVKMCRHRLDMPLRALLCDTSAMLFVTGDEDSLMIVSPNGAALDETLWHRAPADAAAVTSTGTLSVLPDVPPWKRQRNAS